MSNLLYSIIWSFYRDFIYETVFISTEIPSSDILFSSRFRLKVSRLYKLYSPLAIIFSPSSPNKFFRYDIRSFFILLIYSINRACFLRQSFVRFFRIPKKVKYWLLSSDSAMWVSLWALISGSSVSNSVMLVTYTRSIESLYYSAVILLLSINSSSYC